MNHLNEIGVTTLSHIFSIINQPGKQIVSSDFNLGNYPITELDKPDRYLHKVTAKRQTKKPNKKEDAITKHHLDLLVFQLKDGSNLYLHPHYDLRKVNGYTARARNEHEFLIPKNAAHIYRICVEYTGDAPTLDSTLLEVFHYV